MFNVHFTHNFLNFFIYLIFCLFCAVGTPAWPARRGLRHTVGAGSSLSLFPARLSVLTITPRLTRSPRGKLKLRGCFGWRRWCMRMVGGGWWRVVGGGLVAVAVAPHYWVEPFGGRPSPVTHLCSAGGVQGAPSRLAHCSPTRGTPPLPPCTLQASLSPACLSLSLSSSLTRSAALVG